jgi:hypothetical protein
VKKKGKVPRLIWKWQSTARLVEKPAAMLIELDMEAVGSGVAASFSNSSPGWDKRFHFVGTYGAFQIFRLS